MVNFGRPAIPGCRDQKGESQISTPILQTRTAAASRSGWIAAIAIPLMLLAPALWNGYPLLQWDTGGYLARWYEGNLVPSRFMTQQRWRFDFTAINAVRVPVALASMLLAAILFGHGVLRRPFDDLTLLAGTITSAVLGNASICAVISGPHDRYGARMAWLATTVVLIAAVRLVTGEAASRDRSLPA